MKTTVRLSKREYADRYDEHANSLYRLALCVTGDKKEAEAAMAKLFCEGYHSEMDEDFVAHMLDTLRRILESCPPNADSYREKIKALFQDRRCDRLIDILCGLSVGQRMALLQRLMFENRAVS